MAEISKITIDCEYDDFVISEVTGGIIIDFNYWATRYPSNLKLIPTSSSEIGLIWTNNGTIDYTNVCIERSEDGESFSQIDLIGAGESSYTDSTLNSGTQYFYKIRYYKS